ncbi:DUF2189 domain-containing protein [Palleronia sp. KMU-117]|uniref:DUF2189 domain-containing protein n=1 Tax=Palleronia sp. KMU-117 TaxID=3434108 RepID=UPI003D74A013
MADETLQASPLPEVARISLADLSLALRRGAADFRRAPAFGIFFSGFYVLVGLGLWWVGASTFVWSLALSLGFPLVAPFAAVGLYEVSRRLEAGLPLVWSEVLGVVAQERKRQLPWLGAILVIVFLFWSFLAHMIFALFMGLSTMTNISSSYEVLLTPNGLSMIAVEVLIGGAAAFFVFAITVVGMPLLLDREVDFVTAMLQSIRAVRENFAVMLVWAGVIAGCLFLGMLPWFLGLFVALPVLGHATWHIYRRVLPDAD